MQKKYYFILVALIVFSIFSNVMAVESDNANSNEYAKIGVSIAESINGIEINKMSACENAVEKVLADAGCNVVHNKYLEGLESTKIFDQLMISENESTDVVSDEAVNEVGEVEEIPTATKGKIKADILVIGEVNADNLSEEPTVQTPMANIYSARANGHFKAIWVEDGRIITNINEAASGADVTKSLAAKKALSELGEQVGKNILKRLYEFDAKQ